MMFINSLVLMTVFVPSVGSNENANLIDCDRKSLTDSPMAASSVTAAV